MTLAVGIDELGAALGTSLHSCRASLLGRFSCELWHLDVQTAEGHRQRIVLKRPLQMAGRNSLALERRFYQRCAARLDAVPRFLGWLPRIDGLLLEYVADLMPFDWHNGPSDAHAEAAITALAQLHRLPLDDTGWLPRFDAPRRAAIQRDYAQAWSARRDVLTGLYPAFAALGDRLANHLAMALAALAECEVLLHGDAHAENLAARVGGGVAMLDWQDPALGAPGSDVADLIVMSYPVARRREVETVMIDRHAEQFGRTDYDRQAGYQAGVLHRVARIVCIAGHHPNWPSLPWIFERCAAAAVDVAARGAVSLQADPG